MPFSRPSLETLVSRTRADVLTRLSADEALRHCDAEVLARVEAGAAHGLYGYIDWLSRQFLADTAETEWLDRHGSIWGVARKAAATATGTVTFTTQAGAVIPVGATLQAADGAVYQVTAEVLATGASTTAALRAVLAGEAGNRLTGTPLSLTSPLAGVQSSATSGAITGGADVETDIAYRARILARIRRTPHGGAAHDYVAWALEIPGVTRAWCYPEELGLGTVTVRFVRDDDASLIPDSPEVATVQAHIDSVRPVTAQVTVVAPVAAPLAFTISGLAPSNAEVRAHIESALRNLLRIEAEPGETLLISHIREAISTAAGEYDHVLVSPSSNVTHSTGQLATFGGITWT
ncbi:MAG: baseplate J/gp47 family protein [Alphaproteobacteria bacterium]|nr:MAG: baseplate J/gp47 family protein [Alphaproteobacteria bacterium]